MRRARAISSSLRAIVRPSRPKALRASCCVIVLAPWRIFSRGDIRRQRPCNAEEIHAAMPPESRVLARNDGLDEFFRDCAQGHDEAVLTAEVAVEFAARIVMQPSARARRRVVSGRMPPPAARSGSKSPRRISARRPRRLPRSSRSRPAIESDGATSSRPYGRRSQTAARWAVERLPFRPAPDFGHAQIVARRVVATVSVKAKGRPGEKGQAGRERAFS